MTLSEFGATVLSFQLSYLKVSYLVIQRATLFYILELNCIKVIFGCLYISPNTFPKI